MGSARRAELHQGPGGWVADLSLVVPDGDLRQLRHDGRRRAQTELRHISIVLLAKREQTSGRAAALLPDYPGSGDRIERFSS